MTTRAAIYLRQSYDRNETGDAVDRQRKACSSLCDARGWVVVTEYVDNSVSATKNRAENTAFGQMLADAHRDRFDLVVAYAVDRLARRLSDIERIIATGKKAATVQGGLDLTTPEGEAQAGILATFARMEVRQKSQRQKDAHAQRLERGLPPAGGWRAFGYSDDGMSVVEDEAALIRDAATAVIAGASLRDVMRAWNAAGHRTATGELWKPYSTRKALLNPRVAALTTRYTGRGKWAVIGAGTWPAILPEETWRAVHAVLTDPGRRVSPGNARKWLLPGIATCGLCGGPMNTGGTSARIRTLKCVQFQHIARKAEPIEAHVEDYMVGLFSRPDAADVVAPAKAKPDLAKLRAELMVQRTRRDELLLLLRDGVYTASQVRSTAADLDGRIAELETRMAEAGRVEAAAPLLAAGDVRVAWEALPLGQKRSLIQSSIRVVVNRPGRGARGFDPATVTISPAWR